MNDALKKFLESLGISAEVITALAADQQPDGFDVSQAIENFRTTQDAIYLKRFENQFKERGDHDVAIFKKSLSGKLAKQLGLEISRNDAEELGLDGVVAKATEYFKSKLDGAAKEGTEELRAKLDNQLAKIAELTAGLEGWEAKYEQDLTAERQRAAAEIRNFKINDLFNRKFSTVEWGIDPALSEIVQERIKADILGNYHVDDQDGSLLDKDGKNRAVNFAGNGTYVSVEEPIKFLLEKYNAVKKSNGGVQNAQHGNGNPAKPGSGTPTSDNLSPAARALKERIEAAQKRPFGT